MGFARRRSKRLDPELPVHDRDQLPGGHRPDALRLETEIHQRHTLAGGGKQRTFLGVAQRLDAQRIARHHHVTAGVEKHEAVRAIEPAADAAHHVHQARLRLERQLATHLVHDDFRVRLARQVVVAVGQQPIAQRRVVGQLAVEGKAEPLVLPQMVPLERLGVALVVPAARGIPHMADRCQPGVFLHQRFAFARVGEPKYLAHRAHILVGVNQLVTRRIVGRDARGQLTTVLDVQQHPRQQTGNLPRTAIPT